MADTFSGRNTYTYDCEFKEDGKTIDLISIGMVSGDGREFYAVSNEFNTRRVANDDWLMKNVMTSIEHEQFVIQDFEGTPVLRDFVVTDPAAMSKADMGNALLDFIFGPGTSPSKGTPPELWNWYGAYDHVALCQIWGSMMSLPPGMPMFSNDIKQLHKEAGYPSMPRQPEGLHNALADAKFNIVRYNYLKAKAKAEKEFNIRQAVANHTLLSER